MSVVYGVFAAPDHERTYTDLVGTTGYLFQAVDQVATVLRLCPTAYVCVREVHSDDLLVTANIRVLEVDHGVWRVVHPALRAQEAA
jgi:hypothetical protein